MLNRLFISNRIFILAAPDLCTRVSLWYATSRLPTLTALNHAEHARNLNKLALQRGFSMMTFETNVKRGSVSCLPVDLNLALTLHGGQSFR